jgi:hypothetical protein
MQVILNNLKVNLLIDDQLIIQIKFILIIIYLQTLNIN